MEFQALQVHRGILEVLEDSARELLAAQGPPIEPPAELFLWVYSWFSTLLGMRNVLKSIEKAMKINGKQ